MKRVMALIVGLAAIGSATAPAQGASTDYGAVENYRRAQEAYRAFYNSLTPEQKKIETYMDQVFTSHRQRTGEILAPTEENAVAIMRQGKISQQHRSFVVSRMPAHAKNQQARQMLEKAEQDPNCWYLPENFKKQVGC
jgi:hypothetical protein